MTWAFSLSAECGEAQSAAEHFAQHFDNLVWTLSKGGASQCHTTIFQDMDDNWWCRVCPDRISEVGVNAPDTAYLMTELGILLYQQLRSAPLFRYALVGVEVDEFRTYRELSLEPLPNLPGLVLAEPLWRTLGEPPLFRSFRAGYVWQPYEGEVYKPLMVSLVLKDKLNELLVLQ